MTRANKIERATVTRQKLIDRLIVLLNFTHPNLLLRADNREFVVGF